MKTLILILLAVFSITIHARGPGNGGDPTVPWPTNDSLQVLSKDYLNGEWMAFSHNSVWYLNFDCDSANELTLLSMQSQALFTHKARGFLEVTDNRLYFGKIVMDANHIYSAIVFRDHEGTKVRIVKTPQQYFDLKIYRRK